MLSFDFRKLNWSREDLWCHRFCCHRQLFPPGLQIVILLLGCDLFVFTQPSKEHILRPINRGSQFTQPGMQLFDAQPRFQHRCRCRCHFSWRFSSWIGTRRGMRLSDVHIIHVLIRKSCPSRHVSRSRRTLQHMSVHTQTVSPGRVVCSCRLSRGPKVKLKPLLTSFPSDKILSRTSATRNVAVASLACLPPVGPTNMGTVF